MMTIEKGDGTEEKEAIESLSSPSAAEMQTWIEYQDLLRKKLITEDDFPWRLRVLGEEMSEGVEEQLRFVGGVDVSYVKGQEQVACGTLVVVDLISLQVVYSDYCLVTLTVPYVPGFLAFREAPILIELLEKMKKNGNSFYPQLLMTDGNGLLHPRGFGLACHLGVLANLPTIGVGKNLHHVDGLSKQMVIQLLQAEENNGKCSVTLQGKSGMIWGAAMQSTENSKNPIFVSVGNRISLETSIKIVEMTCKYRIPEPIRQADIKSREYLRKHQGP